MPVGAVLPSGSAVFFLLEVAFLVVAFTAAGVVEGVPVVEGGAFDAGLPLADTPFAVDLVVLDDIVSAMD